MHIDTLTFENWQGVQNLGGTVSEPNLRQVETAVCNLDGLRRTLIILESPDGSYLAVGGGNSGRYVISASICDEIYNLVSNMDDKGERSDIATCWIVTGGQGAEYPLRETVDLETALQAAREYATHGTLDSSLVWEHVT